MEKSFKQILEYLTSHGGICDKYSSRVSEARTKSSLAEIISDSNGVQFITHRFSTDISADYQQVAEYLRNHVNGNRVFEHTDDNGESYTSELFVGYSGRIEVRTTLLGVWGCDVTVSVPDYSMVEIDCDSHSSCAIECGEHSKVVCVYWGEKPSVTGCAENIKYIQGKE